MVLNSMAKSLTDEILYSKTAGLLDGFEKRKNGWLQTTAAI